jgi:cytochrome c553
MNRLAIGLHMQRVDARRAVILGALIALLNGGIAEAEIAVPASAAVCQGCHGARGEGNAPAHIPRLSGQSAEYLSKQLKDYASGARANPIMQNFAKPLTEAEVGALATYFAATSAPPVVTPSTASRAQLALGGRLARQGSEVKRVQACDSCHGPDGVGVLHAAPYLAGQSTEYLASALTSFQQGTRKNDPGQLMTSVAKRLEASDIVAVAAYFSSLPNTSL